jgi:hypothetical protein
MFMWGICYGLGLGAALGFAFHRCQSPARKLLSLDSHTQAALQ